jgi:hypothetical protein
VSATKDIEFMYFETDWSKLQVLPKQQLAALSVLSFAVSELNALQRIYLGASHDYIGNKAVDSASNVTKFLILRTWSSKVFEVYEFFQSLQSTKRLDDSAAKIASGAIKEFKALKDSDGYYTARALRNEAAHHYSFKAALKNIEHVPNNMDCNFYTHAATGNDFFPLGEAVMFHARLERQWKNVPTHDEKSEKFLGWLDWCQEAVKWLAKWHAEAFAAFCGAHFELDFQKVSYTVPEHYSGDPVKHSTPLFFEEF